METILANRIRKRYRHLRKWARRNAISCFRLYDRDIPEFPLIVDWYDGEAVVWLYQRKRDETPDQSIAWQQQALVEIQDGLALMQTQLFVKERQRQQGNLQYERMNQANHIRVVEEQGLRFEVNLSDYLDTGLFLDHRNTRALVRNECVGKRVLNLFAYTGSFTCYAIDGGAESTTTVDLSQSYCNWASRNLAHNGFDEEANHQIIQADCLAFLQEAIRRKERYDLIICDPPTFSNSKRMAQGSFDIVRDYPQLLSNCVGLLDRQGILYFSTNARRFKLAQPKLPAALTVEQLTPQTIPQDFRNTRIHQCWRICKN